MTTASRVLPPSLESARREPGNVPYVRTQGKSSTLVSYVGLPLLRVDVDAEVHPDVRASGGELGDGVADRGDGLAALGCLHHQHLALASTQPEKRGGTEHGRAGAEPVVGCGQPLGDSFAQLLGGAPRRRGLLG